MQPNYEQDNGKMDNQRMKGWEIVQICCHFLFLFYMMAFFDSCTIMVGVDCLLMLLALQGVNNLLCAVLFFSYVHRGQRVW